MIPPGTMVCGSCGLLALYALPHSVDGEDCRAAIAMRERVLKAEARGRMAAGVRAEAPDVDTEGAIVGPLLDVAAQALSRLAEPPYYGD